MLKSLELFGFKSFADRVKFDFDPGITCVVGPNGSGKSNVVDAIKWLLGDQSAKSLRGAEMSDVIFNGSAARGGSGFAEAVLTFDNSSGLIPYATREVGIGRRLYRTGESEYLLNGEAVRLKDIRSLFLGTGAGSAAYSIIEQGRVGQILQANPAARRAVFEEAAGVSKFKARRNEAERRLGRVTTNLERLQDIVDETETRLAATRSQASKAAKYRELTSQLRSQWLGLAGDRFRVLTTSIDQLADQCEAEAASESELSEASRSAQLEISRLNEELDRAESELATAEQAAGHTRETLAGLRSTQKAQRQQYGELAISLKQCREDRRKNATALAKREVDIGRTRDTVEKAAEEREQAKVDEDAARRRLQEIDADRAEAESRKDELANERREIESRKTEASADRLATDRRIEQLNKEERRLAKLYSERELELAEAVLSLDRARESAAKVDRDQAAVRDRIDELRDRDQQLTNHITSTREAIVTAREELTATQSRLSVLRDLEPTTANTISAQELIDRAESLDGQPWDSIQGRVGDLVDCDVEDAPLLDLALGPRAHLIATSDLTAVVDYFANATVTLDGRVGFIDARATRGDREVGAPSANAETASVFAGLSQLYRSSDAIDVASEPGVIARADTLVTEGRMLAEQILADTWIVDSLTAARKLQLSYPDLRFLTRCGELVESDGAVFLGQIPIDAAILCRRTEIRELRARTSQLERAIRDASSRLDLLQADRQATREMLADEETRHPDTVRQAGKLQTAIASAIDRLETRRIELEQSEADRATCDRERAELVQRQDVAHAKLAECDAADKVAQRTQEELDEAVYSLSRERAGLEDRLRDLTRKSASVSANLSSEKKRLEEIASDIAALEARVRRDEEQYQSLSERCRDNVLASLNARAARDVLMIDDERETKLVEQLKRARQRIRSSADQVRTHLQTVETQLRKVSALRQQSESRLEQSQADLKRLRERSEEEFEVTLEEAARIPSAYEAFCASLPEDVQQPSFDEVAESLESEAQRTRRKIKTLGSVNTESLRDLDELESRFETLSAQLHDLIAARDTLQEIIDRTNVESRRLFLETFETVRTYFQELFRKCFGGGSADLVLEEAEDVLESGIDILARPPGKDLRNLSLLSGGEKAMTAVALLMALFRAKPSPYCILDEVDAPLDEANIDRFLNVLREFRDETQFVIITHRRRTMTSADVIYGVTMETSGISKRLAVKLDEVAEDGSVRAAA